MKGLAFHGTQLGGRVFSLDPGWRAEVFPAPYMKIAVFSGS